MKLTEKVFNELKENGIYPYYMELAEEFVAQMLDSMDWKNNNAQEVTAFWLMVNFRRREKAFLCQGQECSWEDLYHLIGKECMKHDYPFYFDENGNDVFPLIMK